MEKRGRLRKNQFENNIPQFEVWQKKNKRSYALQSQKNWFTMGRERNQRMTQLQYYAHCLFIQRT